jgi:hypothetical protein
MTDQLKRLKRSIFSTRTISTIVVIIISAVVYYLFDYSLKDYSIIDGVVITKANWIPLIIHLFFTVVIVAGAQIYHRTILNLVNAFWNSEFVDNYFIIKQNRNLDKDSDNVIEKSEKSDVLISLCLSAIIIVLLSLLFPIHFHVNDDLAIESFLAEGHDAVFLSVLAGKFIKFLYTLHNGVGFYALTLMFVHFLSLAALLYCFIGLIRKRELPPILSLFIAVASILFFIQFIVSLTFTTTAFMVGFSGIALFICSIYKTNSKYLPQIVSGVLLSISFLFRSMATYGVLLFSLPILIGIVIVYFKGNIRSLIFSFLLLLLPLFITRYAEYFTYKYGTSEEYKNFRRFNAVRGQIHDNMMAFEVFDNEEVFQLNGWSKNDFLILLQWFFAHEDKYNVTTLSNVVNAYPKSSEGEKLKQFFYRIPEASKRLWNRYYLGFLLFINVILITLHKRNAYFIFLVILNFIYVFFALIYLSDLYLIKDRVFDPVILGTTIVPFFFVSIQKNLHLYPKYISAFFSLVIAVLTIFIVKEQIKSTLSIREVYERRRILKEQVKESNDKYNDYIILTKPGKSGLGFVNKNPFKSNDYQLNYFSVGGGWTTFSPHYYQRLEKGLGIKKAKDILPIFIDNPHAIVIGPNNFITSLKIFIVETYNVEVDFVKVPQLGTDNYRIVSR